MAIEYASALSEDEPVSPSVGQKQSVSAAKNKRVQQHHAWKKKAYKGMPGARVNTKEVEKDDEEKYERRYLSNHTHFSTTDADARVSVKPGKPRQLNYLGQVSTDTAHHVITNIEAHHADKKDSQCLPAVLTNTICNLHGEGLVVEEILADTGYSSGEALKALEEKNIVGYIPNLSADRQALGSTSQQEKASPMIKKTTGIPAPRESI